MSPLPAYGLPRLQSYDPLTACRSRSLLRLLTLRETLVRTPRGLDDPAAGLPGLCLGFRARPTSALPLPHLSPRLWEISGRVGFLRLRRNRAANSKILRVLWLRLIHPISIGSAAFNSNSASYLSRDGYGPSLLYNQGTALLSLLNPRVSHRAFPRWTSSSGAQSGLCPSGLRRQIDHQVLVRWLSSSLLRRFCTVPAAGSVKREGGSLPAQQSKRARVSPCTLAVPVCTAPSPLPVPMPAGQPPSWTREPSFPTGILRGHFDNRAEEWLEAYSETFVANETAPPLRLVFGQWLPSRYSGPPSVAVSPNPVQLLRASSLTGALHMLELTGSTYGGALLGGLPVAMPTAVAAGIGPCFHVLRLVADGNGRREPWSRIHGGGCETTVYTNWAELSVADIERLCRVWMGVCLLQISSVYVDGLEVELSESAVQSLAGAPAFTDIGVGTNPTTDWHALRLVRIARLAGGLLHSLSAVASILVVLASEAADARSVYAGRQAMEVGRQLGFRTLTAPTCREFPPTSAFERVPSVPPNLRQLCLVGGASDPPEPDPLGRWVGACPDAPRTAEQPAPGVVPCPPVFRSADPSCYARNHAGQHLTSGLELAAGSSGPDACGLTRLSATERMKDDVRGPLQLYSSLVLYALEKASLAHATGSTGLPSCGVCHPNEWAGSGAKAARMACAGLGAGGAPCRVGLPCSSDHPDGSSELRHWLRWFNTAAAAELRDDLPGAPDPTFLSPALFAEDAAHGADSSFVARGPPPAWLLRLLSRSWGEGWPLPGPVELSRIDTVTPTPANAAARATSLRAGRANGLEPAGMPGSTRLVRGDPMEPPAAWAAASDSSPCLPDPLSAASCTICGAEVPAREGAPFTPRGWRQDLSECALLDVLQRQPVCGRCLFEAGDLGTPVPETVVSAGLCGAFCSLSLRSVLQFIAAEQLAVHGPFRRLRSLMVRQQRHEVRCTMVATLGLSLIAQLRLYARLGEMAMLLASHTDGLATAWPTASHGAGLTEGVDGVATVALRRAHTSALRGLSLLKDLDNLATAACVPGRLLRELFAAGELCGDLFTVLHWVPLPVALGLAMVARLTALGYGSLAGEDAPAHATAAADLLLAWAGAAEFLRRWMLWPGPAPLAQGESPNDCHSVGEVLSLLESLVPGERGQFGGVPLCVGYQCAHCLGSIGDLGAFAPAPCPELRRFVQPVLTPTRTPGLPCWARSLWARPIGASDAIRAFSRGTMAEWLHRGFAGWGDYSQLIAPGPGFGDLGSLRLYEEVYTDVGASDLTAAPAAARDIPTCLPGGQPPAMSDAGHRAYPRLAAEYELAFGTALRQDLNANPQADWGSACLRWWPYDSSMCSVISLLLGPPELRFMRECGVAWDVGDPGEWVCARRSMPVHRGSCGVSCVACSTPLPIAGGVPCLPLSHAFFHVQGPLDSNLARLELLALVYLASWSEMIMDLEAEVDKNTLAAVDWARAALRAHLHTRSALAQQVEENVEALFGSYGLTCAEPNSEYAWLTGSDMYEGMDAAARFGSQRRLLLEVHPGTLIRLSALRARPVMGVVVAVKRHELEALPPDADDDATLGAILAMQAVVVCCTPDRHGTPIRICRKKSGFLRCLKGGDIVTATHAAMASDAARHEHVTRVGPPLSACNTASMMLNAVVVAATGHAMLHHTSDTPACSASCPYFDSGACATQASAARAPTAASPPAVPSVPQWADPAADCLSSPLDAYAPWDDHVLCRVPGLLGGPLPALECALFVVGQSKATDSGSRAPFRSSIICLGCAPQKQLKVCSFGTGHPCTLQGTTFYVSAGMLVCAKCIDKSKKPGATAEVLATCWPGVNQEHYGPSLEVLRFRLETDPEGTLSGLNRHVVALERLPNGDWRAMTAAGMLQALEHGRLLRGSWTPPTLGQVFSQFQRQTDPTNRVVWPTSLSPANTDGSPEVRPFSTFFGPMHPMEPRMHTAEGLVVVNQDAGSREGANRGSRRGAKQSRRAEQPRLSTVDDPLEHAGWGSLPKLKGYPRIVAWGVGSAPAGAVKWGAAARA